MRNRAWLILGSIVLLLLVIWALFALVSSGWIGTIIATVILWALMTGLIYALRQIGLAWLIIWFGERDVWWSPIRMKPGPGHIVMMTKGRKPDGPFAMIIAGHIPYWHYHEGDRRFYRESDSPIKSDPPFREKFPDGPPILLTGGPAILRRALAEAGAVWTGFLRRYYRRTRRWDAWDIQPNSTKYGLVRKETKPEEEHIFYFATTVAVDLETVPTKDSAPAQMKLIENILFIHPEKAEFLAGKWETQAIAATRNRAREYIASKTLEALRDERDSNNPRDFVDHILFANEGDPDQPQAATVRLLPEYGVFIQGPYYADYDLESGDKEMTDAMKRQMIAREDVKTAGIRKDETIVKAEAEREKRRIEAQGTRDARIADAEGIRVEFAARMSVPEGADLSWAEAVKTAAPKYIALGRDGKGGLMVGVNETPDQPTK